MSQYNFGVIDPYVVDGVQLAGMLNNWRDALHSWHRGPTRPPYVVPGMMWIDDSAGATDWIVKVFISVALGDRDIFHYNTTTGDIQISAATGGTLAAATLLASAAGNPAVAWTSTANPIDAKRWSMTVNAAGALVLSSLSDAGVVQQSFTFSRDGTMPGPTPMRLLKRMNVAAPIAQCDIQNVPSDINDLMFTFDLVPATNAVALALQFYDNVGALDNVGGHYPWAIDTTHQSLANSAASLAFGSATTGSNNGIYLSVPVATANISNNATFGARGRGTIANIKAAARAKSMDFQSSYLMEGDTTFRVVTGSGWRNIAGAITGFRLVFSAGNVASGSFSVWGSP